MSFISHKNTLGNQILLDYVWTEHQGISNEYLAFKLHSEIERIISESPLKIVHKNICLLPIKGHDSEIGSTAYFSLDSSHACFHIYYDRKLLALDLFGCGEADLGKIANEIDDVLKLINPTFNKVWLCGQKRFHYPVDSLADC